MKLYRLLIAVVLGLELAFFWLWALLRAAGPALAQGASVPIPPSLDRPDDPIVITGGLLSNMAGVPVGQIFAYAYQGSTLNQIPFQIDERTAGGLFVAPEDGLLDSNDEVVFMAADGGGWVDNPAVDAGGSPLGPTYVITLTDPLSSSARAWVYLFSSSALTNAVSTDYVNFISASDRVVSPGRYAIGFNPTRGVRDYLTLGSTNVDVLDRDKLRVTLFGFVQASEENVTQNGVYALDGAVRVTRVATTTLSVLTVDITTTVTVFAYSNLFAQPIGFIHPDAVPINAFRFSTDWNAQAAGMTYYDANTAAGVTINGVPDAVSTTPATRWNQAASVTSTVITVINIPANLGGAQTTYYRDDSALDSGDTGDQRSYGDAGLRVTNPNTGTFTFLRYTYFLTGTLANVGATYLGRYDNPVQVSIGTLQNLRLYLPLVMK